MILSGRYGDPYGRAGDLCRIRESWHVCLWCSYNRGWPLNVERMVDVMWCAARCLVLSARRGRYYSEALSLFNRPLPSPKNRHFQNEATYTTFPVKMSIICMRMKNDFHIKGWTPTHTCKHFCDVCGRATTIDRDEHSFCAFQRPLEMAYNNYNFLLCLPY